MKILEESGRAVDGSNAHEWPKSNLQICFLLGHCSDVPDINGTVK